MNDRQNMNQPVIDEFRSAGGKVGGFFAQMDLLLLHHVGVKSGAEYVSPLAVYRPDGTATRVIIASNGGRDTHPAWYHNLLARPETAIEVPDGSGGVATVKVRAREIEGRTWTETYDAVSAKMPLFAEYAAGTSRRIPLVALEPVD